MLKKPEISKKSILIVIIIIVGFIAFSFALFSSPKEFKQREHETANVVLFSKGEDESLIKALNIDTDAIHLTLITESNIKNAFNEKLLTRKEVQINNSLVL